MDISLIVFDIAGTTVNDADSVNRSIRGALAAVGITADSAQVNAVMGLPKPEAIARLVEQAGRHDLGPLGLRSIHDDFVARSLHFYRRDASVHEVPDASLVFRTLKDAGICIALDTGFSRAITRIVLERVGWLDLGLIDATVCSDEVARGRPHPDMIRAMMASCGVADPRRVAKVGDTPVDLLEGHHAGCGLNAGVTFGTHRRDQLEPYPHTHLIDSLRDLPALLGIDLKESAGA
jgi:phosphonatase-like hydrolase